MRIIILIFFVLIGLNSCGPVDNNDTGTIVFVTRPVQSQSLRVTPRLKFHPGESRIELDLELKSLVPEKIEIVEVALNNLNGLKSLPENSGDRTLSIAGNKDTTLQLTFMPINDKSLFQATGLPGLIDSTYTLSVFYSVEGKEGIRVVNLHSRMPEEVFLSYKKLHNTPVQIYYFNTTTDFNERQGKFLKTNGVAGESPFVHLTEQEVAVSGLNFRIKCFHKKDSLYAEIFVVNHSDMTIRIDAPKMNFILDGVNPDISATELSNEKVTGSKNEPDILRKGDRTIIKMRKYIRDYPERLELAFVESFILSSGKPLFNENPELIRFSKSLEEH